MTDYITAEEIKDELPDVDWSEGLYDDFLELIATRVSRLIDRATNREEGAYKSETATARTFDGSGGRYQWVDEMAAAPSAVEVSEDGTLTYTAWASTDYMLWPYNALAKGRPYVRLDVDQLNGNHALWYAFPKSVRVTAKWGYSTAVPEDLMQAVVTQCVRWFKRAQQAYQDVGGAPEVGQIRYWTRQLDPDVLTLCDMYRRVVV